MCCGCSEFAALSLEKNVFGELLERLNPQKKGVGASNPNGAWKRAELRSLLSGVRRQTHGRGKLCERIQPHLISSFPGMWRSSFSKMRKTEPTNFWFTRAKSLCDIALYFRTCTGTEFFSKKTAPTIMLRLLYLVSLRCLLPQMHRLLRACAQQQINQTASRKEILRGDCASKSIIVQYVGLCAGDYLQRLLAPTIRALQGPWTANEAGLKGFFFFCICTIARAQSVDQTITLHCIVPTELVGENSGLTYHTAKS